MHGTTGKLLFHYISILQLGRIEDEDWRVRQDGSRFWANVIITALFDDSGELVGFAKVTRDLTERKQHEDDLRKSNLVLKQQQKELKILNAAKDEFISLASHQLRTPATAVKQLLGVLMDGLFGELSTDQLSVIEKAYDSNERQITIVNDLLRVAQIDAGKIVIRKSPVDINALLGSIIEEQSDTIARRKQVITLKPSNQSTVALVDEQYLRMALDNIIDNASKYTHDSGRIKVSTIARNNSIRVVVQDNGVGVAASDIEKLFEKFKRIPNELSQGVAGSGLGLYWVRKVIEMHDGQIKVESSLGEGTTFYVDLPLSGADA